MSQEKLFYITAGTALAIHGASWHRTMPYRPRQYPDFVRTTLGNWGVQRALIDGQKVELATPPRAFLDQLVWYVLRGKPFGLYTCDYLLEEYEEEIKRGFYDHVIPALKRLENEEALRLAQEWWEKNQRCWEMR